MLTKFRNFMDRMSQRFVDWFCQSPNQVWTKDDEIDHLEKRVKSYLEAIQQAEKRIAALTERNGELEHANENLLIQRMEVRKRLDELGRYFPK